MVNASRELTVSQCTDVATALRLGLLFGDWCDHPPTDPALLRRGLAGLAIACSPYVQGVTALELTELFLTDEALLIRIVEQIASTEPEEFRT